MISFFAGLFILITFLYRQAFTILYFQDDYVFLQVSRINSLSQFFNFFSLNKGYSYRPLAGEVFYFLINLFGKNPFISHLIVFGVYFIGLIYLYKIAKILTTNNFLSKIFIFLYAVHFTHVFQLYWLISFQEVLLFTALVGSFYYLIKDRLIPSLVFFIVGLLSKETALFFIPFTFFFKFLCSKKLKKITWKKLIPYIALGVVFYLLYKVSWSNLIKLDNYKINLNQPKTFINNILWHGLWAMGLPNFMPDVTRSIFFEFLPDFYKYLKIFDIKAYFILLGLYWFSFITTLSIFLYKNNKEFVPIIKYAILAIISFFIFLGPILFLPHRWMVRLMIPVVFLCLFQAYVFFIFYKNKPFRIMAIILLIIYLSLNYLGIKVHESSSNYLFENKISINAKNYFTKNYAKLSQCKYIYFADSADILKNPWGGSKKLKNSLWGQFFLDYYFPNKKIQAIYSFESKNPPPQGACLINSYEDILR